jgi:hypothetical protein
MLPVWHESYWSAVSVITPPQAGMPTMDEAPTIGQWWELCTCGQETGHG